MVDRPNAISVVSSFECFGVKFAELLCSKNLVVFRPIEYIFGIGKAIAKYGQIMIITLLSWLSDPERTTVYCANYFVRVDRSII